MIVWGPEHPLRAANLAAAVRETAADGARFFTTPANIPASTDPALTIWGHGDPAHLAGLTPQACADFIKAWKRKNPSLNTVELVTCDVRHSETDHESFTDQLMPLLVDSNVGKVLVNIKTLPRGGSHATTSRLWATEAAGSDGYFFIAADSDTALQAGTKIFQDAFAQVPHGTAEGRVYQALIPIAKAASDKAAMKAALGYVTSGGLLTTLRSLLVPVTVYVAGGQRVAVPKTLV